MAAGRISILIADHHTLVRESVAACFGHIEEIDVVGMASTGDLAIVEAVRLQPDVVVMDVDMPGVTGFDAASKIAELCPDTRVILVGDKPNDQQLHQALETNSAALLDKTDSLQTLVRAIRRVAAGDVFISQQVKRRIVESRQDCKSRTRVAALTRREIQILRYVARGLAKKQIARLLSLSIKTVANHADNLMKKLDIHDRVELAHFAISEGLIKPASSPDQAIIQPSEQPNRQPHMSGQIGPPGAGSE